MRSLSEYGKFNLNAEEADTSHQAAVSTFFVSACRQCTKDIKDSHSSNMMKAVINELLPWIDENIDRQLSVSEIAERAGYSKWHFQRNFSDVTGRTLSEYIRRRRMLIIGSEIIKDEVTLTEIAFKYNFSSQQAFSRAFKIFFGVTPTKFRKGCRIVRLEEKF